MKISTLMTSDPITCLPTTNLAEAAALMLQGDCGVLPVVDQGKLSGIVTDRDLFIALGTRNLPASAVTVGEVATSSPIACGPDDEVEAVLEIMQQHRVRRVPVVGFGNTVIGIVSLNDLVLAAGRRKVHGADIVSTMQSICSHHHPVPRIAVA